MSAQEIECGSETEVDADHNDEKQVHEAEIKRRAVTDCGCREASCEKDTEAECGDDGIDEHIGTDDTSCRGKTFVFFGKRCANINGCEDLEDNFSGCDKSEDDVEDEQEYELTGIAAVE